MGKMAQLWGYVWPAFWDRILGGENAKLFYCFFKKYERHFATFQIALEYMYTESLKVLRIIPTKMDGNL